jgi:kynurenine 3-monooxygenase
LLPGTYVSQYELVSFSTTPYSAVRRRVRAQQGLLACAGLAASVAIAGGMTKIRRQP